MREGERMAESTMTRSASGARVSIKIPEAPAPDSTIKGTSGSARALITEGARSAAMAPKVTVMRS